jgi:hypothetical protein
MTEQPELFTSAQVVQMPRASRQPDDFPTYCRPDRLCPECQAWRVRATRRP